MSKEKVYGLRTVASNMISRNNFKWPKRGKVSCPDWQPSAECGNGLHATLWGEGDGSLFNWSPDAIWQVVRIDSDYIDLGGKIKFEHGYVVYSGDRKTATDKIIELGATGAVIGALRSVGDRQSVQTGYTGSSTSGKFGTSTSGYEGTSTSGAYGTSTSGYRGTSTSGFRGTSTSGRFGTSTSGDYGTSSSGRCGTSTSGEGGTSTSGYRGTSTSGDYGTSISGDYGTSTSGDYGTSISGYRGTSISGYRGTSISGDYGTSTSGDDGTLIIEWWDGSCYRKAIAYVGENGIKANTPYKLNDKGEFVEVIE